MNKERQQRANVVLRFGQEIHRKNALLFYKQSGLPFPMGKNLPPNVLKFQENLAKTPYYCSVGYAYSPDNSQSRDDLIRLAEEKMCLEKSEFYKHAEFDRRKV